VTSTVLVRDWLQGIQSELQDQNPPFRRWTEIELIRFLNYGRLAIAKYLPQVSARTDDIKLAAGARQDLSRVVAASIKPGDGSGAVDTDGIAFMRAVCNMGGDGLTMGRAVRGPVDRYTKDSFEPLWQTESGAEVLEIVFDRNLPLQFFVSPALAVSGDRWLRVEWMANPPKLPDGGAPGAEKYVVGGSQASTVLGVPDAFAEDLHHYVVAASLMKGSKNTQNLPKAQIHAGLFINSLNAQAKAATGVNPNLTALPFLNELGG
jgi:hypothetical protein